VWLQLLRDERGGTACAAVADLARRCGLSPRTVKRHLAELRRRGLLVVVREGSPEAGAAVYRLRAVVSRRSAGRAPGSG
jgi:DNA-binding transcriptional ArsR family regulator